MYEEECISHFSTELSEDIKKYAMNTILLDSRYIFTTRKGRQQYGYCTHCQKTFKTDGLKHNSKFECHECKSMCKVKASGIGRATLTDEAYFVYYQKSILDPNIITARGIYAVRDYRGDYLKVKTHYADVSLYVFKIGDCIMLRRYSYYGHSSGSTKLGIHYGAYEKCKSIFCAYNMWHMNNVNVRIGCCNQSITDAVENTPFKYCDYKTYERYVYNDFVEFFGLYAQYPHIEYLTKVGLKGIVETKLLKYKTYSAINWRGDTLFRMLKINKNNLKEIKERGIELTCFFLKLFQISKKDGSNISLKQIQKMEKDYINKFSDLQKILKYTSLQKADKYIEKQTKEESKYISGHYESDTIITWKDYIADCIKLEMDLKSDNVLFPRDLYTAHQNTIKQIKLNADETLNLKMKARIKSLEKYCLESNGLIIRPARSSNELIEEGKALSHCVGTYADRHASGETNILLIRKVSELDKPYYTVEVKKDIIIQVHGKNNRSPDKDVTEFIEVFKRKKLTNKKSKTQNRISIPA